MIHLKKTIIALILLNLGFMHSVNAQSPGFEQDDIIKIPGQTTDAQISSLTLSQKLTSRTFVDGLGRTIQTVAIQASPTQKDLIQPIAYDNLGRQIKSYLPYASSVASGLYRPAALTAEQAAFYNNGTADKIADDTSPFSQSVFENSPLQRLLQAGSVGANFQPGVHYTSMKYTTNVAGDAVIEWATDGSYSNTYGPGVLAVTDAIDADGKETKVFTDLNGHTVLKRELANQTVNGVVEGHFDTYYVYNSAGELIYLIPQKALSLMVHNASYSLTQAGVLNLIFSYKYDNLGRLIKKTVPGSAELYMVYDSQNRPVLMQDGNLRVGHQWNYIKYDSKNRPISQGIYTDITYTTLATMQAHVNGITPGYESRVSTFPYYSNTAFPTAGLEQLAYSIFDDYNLDLDVNNTPDYSYTPQGLTNEATQTTLTRGMLTVSIKRSVGTGLTTPIWLTSVIFYDKHGNLIQVKSNNQLNTATTLTDTKTSVPDFTGKTLQTLVIKVTGTTPVTNKILTTMNYDAPTGNRLVSVDQTYNSQAAVRIAAYTYNEMGQLVTKQLGNTSGTTGTTYLQNVDYRYNIHGQLTTINNSTLTNDSGTANTNGDYNDLFGMQIMYELPDANLGTVTPSYTGNISAVKWMSKNSAGTNTNERSFKYTYDKLNRFAGDSYAERTGGSGSFNLDTGYFSESNIHYDESGNFISINRKASGTQIDQLQYLYDPANPNRLNTVTDGDGTSNYTGAGFRNLTGVSTAYTYASNGNLVNDYYKGITIGYNELNRTDKITVNTSTKRFINYIYDAGGSLIRKQSYDNNILQTTTDYVDGFVYVNNTLSYLPMPEGRVMNVGGTLKPEYIITDQQGNARFSFQDSGTGTAKIVQENSYYASGLIMPNSPVSMPTTPNKQLYNGGSEWQNDYSNLPDYYQTFYRNYDAALSRFVAVDPEAESAESMSTYQYAGNNPINNNDPMGNIYKALMPYNAYSNFGGNGGGGGGTGGGDFLAALDEQASWGLYGLDPTWATEKAYQAVGTSGISETNNHDGTWTIVDNTGPKTQTSRVNDDGSPGGKDYTFQDDKLAFAPSANDEYTNTYTNWKGAATNHYNPLTQAYDYGNSTTLTEAEGLALLGDEQSDADAEKLVSMVSDNWDWMKSHFDQEASIDFTKGVVGYSEGKFAGYEWYHGRQVLESFSEGTGKKFGLYGNNGEDIYGGQIILPEEFPIGLGANHDKTSGDYNGSIGFGIFGYEKNGSSNFIGIDASKEMGLYFLGINIQFKFGFKW